MVEESVDLVKQLNMTRKQLKDCAAEQKSLEKDNVRMSKRVKEAEKNQVGWNNMVKEDKAQLASAKNNVKITKNQLKKGVDHAGKPLTDSGRKQLQKQLGKHEYTVEDRTEGLQVDKQLQKEGKAHVRKLKAEAKKLRRQHQNQIRKCDNLRVKLKKMENK
ncbi:MAG: hypothetical protein GY952_03560 [Rhodobacteraceae bacterium]|nr:hypothetical protein [Paracoccaceae bacterium]